MKQTLRLAALSLALGLGLLGAGPMAAPAAIAQAQAQPTLPMVTLQAGIHLVKAEVADDERKRAVGLMFRESLAPNHGMLFVFREKAGHCFWMRNTLIPLDMVFIAADGRVHRIHERAVPQSLATISSNGPVRATLELQGGAAERLNLRVGDRVEHRIFGTSR